MYTFNDDSIIQKRGKSRNFIEWSEILVVHERKEMFQLYISKNKAILLNKGFFSSLNDKTQFKKIMTEHINPDKIKFL
ncbi:YcxB family protein [Sutcliffiella rhizosphaerae]